MHEPLDSLLQQETSSGHSGQNSVLTYTHGIKGRVDNQNIINNDSVIQGQKEKCDLLSHS